MFDPPFKLYVFQDMCFLIFDTSSAMSVPETYYAFNLLILFAFLKQRRKRRKVTDLLHRAIVH
jgi:hypothetical protein